MRKSRQFFNFLLMAHDRFDAQKFLNLAGEEGIINLNITLKELASSKSFGYFNAFADDGEYVICPDLIFWKGPGPRREDLFGNVQLTNSLKESLRVSNDIAQKLAVIKN